ncbi:MAG TPA: multiheme c-type cytochrome [Blastocatellia bacterium]|nr:multiheme c-type cytochrome [Blastocatellia bacterium]
MAPLRPQNRNPQKAMDRTFDPSPDWRPTRAPVNARYVGNESCSQCHTEGVTQANTPMAQAMEPVAERRLLKKHAQLTFKQGPFLYSIAHSGDQSIYTVTDGKDTISLPILYAFGQGKVAQTYVFQYDGKFYEGRVSFYGRINGLDLTMGAPLTVPASLEGALGRVLNSELINDCFSCHSTAAVGQGQLQLDKMSPGITCEGCHGAGEKHVLAMKARGEARNRGEAAPESSDRQIFNPGRFDTEGLTQFCGACHRSWIQVQMLGIRGVENVRFQPYRIFKSKCYDHRDKRIGCTACHNPHEELVTDAAYYDARCMACHQSTQKAGEKAAQKPAASARPMVSARKAPVCPKARQDCASCHMPKIELPGSHYKFTDHRIRVARQGDPYPN